MPDSSVSAVPITVSSPYTRNVTVKPSVWSLTWVVNVRSSPTCMDVADTWTWLKVSSSGGGEAVGDGVGEGLTVTGTLGRELMVYSAVADASNAMTAMAAIAIVVFDVFMFMFTSQGVLVLRWLQMKRWAVCTYIALNSD